MYNNIFLLGLGFMGASIAGALKSRNGNIKITGYDVSSENAEFCLSRGLIDESVDLKNHKTDPDLSKGKFAVIMCMPPSEIIRFMEENAVFLEKASFVTDIGSIKNVITESPAARNIKNFVGSHPMCGSDKSGPVHYDSGLLKNKSCIVIKEPGDSGDSYRLGKIKEVADLWVMLGMRVIYSTSEVHDYMTAYTSHLPHLVAFMLSDIVFSAIFDENHKGESLNFIGSGFRDTTRIASSHPELWADIFLMNRQNITASLESFISYAGLIKGFVESGDLEGLSAELRKIYLERKEAGF